MVKSIFTGSRSALQMAVKRIDAASDTAARRAVSDIGWMGSDQHNPLIMQDKGMIKRLF